MANCAQHSSRIAVTTIHGRPCCTQCNAGIVSARSRVDRHVEPKECFVRFMGGDNWQPISGTGAAHWIAHQKKITRSPSSDTCLAGCVFDPVLLIRGLPTLPFDQVRVGSLYVSPSEDHVGIVSRVEPAPAVGGKVRIFIKHDSNRQGGVVESEFGSDFQGQGTFRR